MTTRVCVGARTVLAVLAPAACAHPHPDSPAIESSSGGDARPCVVPSEAASSTGDTDTPAAPLVGTYAWRIPAGAATELDVDVGADGWMGARFHSPGLALDWDIHSHEGDEVIVHEHGEDVSGFVELHTPAPGLYSLYWHNPGPGEASLCVELYLDGEAALHPR